LEVSGRQGPILRRRPVEGYRHDGSLKKVARTSWRRSDGFTVMVDRFAGYTAYCGDGPSALYLSGKLRVPASLSRPQYPGRPILLYVICFPASTPGWSKALTPYSEPEIAVCTSRAWKT
jgi:hypothetical protein